MTLCLWCLIRCGTKCREYFPNQLMKEEAKKKEKERIFRIMGM